MRNESKKREVLWHTGSFVCELRSISDLPFPTVLCVLEDDEPVVEVPVLSALEAEERAHSLRMLVDRALVNRGIPR
jgi:hypothetical protein